MSEGYIQGPFRHGDRWRVVYRDAGGRQRYASFETEQAARDARTAALAEHDQRVIGLVSCAIELPHDPVWVYMLHAENGDVLYVGLTRDPDGRLHDHRENGVPFARMTLFPEVFAREVGLSVEAALIRKHRPPLNEKGHMETLWKQGHLREMPRTRK